MRTLDLDEAPESVPQFRQQAFIFGAFRLVRFEHKKPGPGASAAR